MHDLGGQGGTIVGCGAVLKPLHHLAFGSGAVFQLQLHVLFLVAGLASDQSQKP